MSFLENFDKDEGIINKNILPAINQINLDETLNEIKDNKYDLFSNLTGDYVFNCLTSFEIFNLPPVNLIPLETFKSLFLIDYNRFLELFKQELINKNPDSFVNFINNLFTFFTNPAGGFISSFTPLTIVVQPPPSVYLLTNEDISSEDILNNSILKGLNEILLDKEKQEKVKLKINEINSYISFYILKYLASQITLTFTGPPPSTAPIPVNLIGLLIPMQLFEINQELLNKVNQILEE